METPLRPEVQAEQLPKVSSTSSRAREPATLYRDEVSGVVEGGLGLFLQHLELDASFAQGQFRGFRIMRLSPPDYWQGVDLRPGDVVTRVNGMSIERPFEAHRAFTSLKTADQLVVNYLRAGEPRQLVYRIKPRPVASSTPAPKAKGRSAVQGAAAPGKASGAQPDS